MKNKYKLLSLLGLLPFLATAQLTNNGATIVIEQGATLVVEGAITNSSGAITNSGTIEVKGNFTNNGTLTSTNANSDIIFSGAEQQTFDPGAAASVHKVTINQEVGATGDVVLQNPLTITGSLVLTEGKMDIGANDLTLPSTGAVTGSNSSYIIADANGKAIRSFANEASFEFPVGGDEYSPLLITAPGTPAGSLVSVNVEEDATTTSTERPFGAEDFINRDWEITTTNFGASDAIVARGQYQDTDLGVGSDETQMVGALYDMNAVNEADEWSFEGSSVDAANNYVSATITGNDDLFLTGMNTLRRQAIRAFLAGPFNGTNMNIGLNTAGLIPSGSPYDAGVTTYPGAVSSFPGTNPVVDWIEIELRDATDETVVLDSYSKFLLQDGTVVDPVDGATIATFRDAPEAAFVAVKHRNHLGVMSGTSLTLGLNTLDFTDPLTGTFGTNAQNNLSGTTAMWAGDANSNGLVSFFGFGNDLTSILTTLSGGTSLSGYYDQDINMNGLVSFFGFGNDATSILFSLSGASSVSQNF